MAKASSMDHHHHLLSQYSLTSQPASPWFLSLLALPFLSLLFIIITLRLLRNRNSVAVLKLPPRPPGLPIIGNLHQLGGIPHRSIWMFSQKYGPIMLLQLGLKPTLVVSSPEMAKEVLKTNDADCCSRPPSYGFMRLSYNHLDLASGPYSDYWREMRKLCFVELFTVKRVRSFSHVRAEEVARLIHSLSQESHNIPIKVGEKIFSLSKSIVCKIAFGKTSYGGKQFESGKFQESMNEAMAMLSGFWGADFFPFFYIGHIVDMFTGLHGRLEKCFREFDDFYDSVVEEHLDPTRPKPEHEDIVDILVGLSRDESSQFPITKDHIKAILMNIFIGGIDTGSVTIEWAMTELVRNPRVMKKVQSEIRGCIGNKPIVEEIEVEKLTYLKMVVKETFRLHPVVPLLVPRETMRHCKIGGYDVCPKTRVLVNVWAMGRDPETWKDPDMFYPERFAESAIDFKGQHFELVPFGAGRRICPGLTMAETTIEFTLANLLHCFNWDLPTGMRIEDINMEEEVGLTAHKKEPLYLVSRKYNRED